MPSSPKKRSSARCTEGSCDHDHQPTHGKLNEEGAPTMKLTTTTNVSVDGVMQGLGGPDEDRSGGFERGGWAIPLLDADMGDYLNQVYGGAAALLFGRRTYEIFAGSWGPLADPSTRPIAAALHRRPKHVVSTSLPDPRRAGPPGLHGDVATAVRGRKAHL